jgi:polar amino acid transport system substrate-binding protein
MPWARAETDVKKGAYDILPDVWMTDARKKEMMFSKPYVSNKVKFILLKDNPFEYQGLKSLKGKTIGTVRGYGYGDEFLKSTDFKRDEVVDINTNLKKLVMKRIDMTLEDEIVAKAKIAEENPKLLDQIRFSKNSFSINDLHIASGLKNPRHKEIIEAFNKGLEIIKTDGTAARILADYGIK